MSVKAGGDVTRAAAPRVAQLAFGLDFQHFAFAYETMAGGLRSNLSTALAQVVGDLD